MIKSYMALVLANQETDGIRGLTKYRPIATIPFAGRYRILDFALTNLTRAGVKNIGIIANNGSTRSIKDHVRGGQFWDLNRKDDGVFLLPSTIESEVKDKNLKNFRANLEYIHRSEQEHVVIYPGNLIGNIDILKVMNSHEKSGKELTIVYKSVDNSKKCSGDTTIIMEDGVATKFGTAINLKEKINISLGIKIIKKETLLNLLISGVQNGVDGDISMFLEKSIDTLSTNCYKVEGYSKLVKTTIDYCDASKDVLERGIRQELLLSNGGISTKINDTPPAHYEASAIVENSLVANGCRVKGTIKDSIIGRRVKVGKGAIIENSIILQSCVIEEGAHIKNVIMDKNTTIGKSETLIGSGSYPMVIEKKSFLDR